MEFGFRPAPLLFSALGSKYRDVGKRNPESDLLISKISAAEILGVLYPEKGKFEESSNFIEISRHLPILAALKIIRRPVENPRLKGSFAPLIIIARQVVKLNNIPLCAGGLEFWIFYIIRIKWLRKATQ